MRHDPGRGSRSRQVVGQMGVERVSAVSPWLAVAPGPMLPLPKCRNMLLNRYKLWMGSWSRGCCISSLRKENYERRGESIKGVPQGRPGLYPPLAATSCRSRFVLMMLKRSPQYVCMPGMSHVIATNANLPTTMVTGHCPRLHSCPDTRLSLDGQRIHLSSQSWGLASSSYRQRRMQSAEARSFSRAIFFLSGSEPMRKTSASGSSDTLVGEKMVGKGPRM